MKYIDLYEQFIPKLNNEPVEVSSIGSFGQRITNKGKNKIKKQDVIVATDFSIHQIVKSEMKRLGKDANLNHIDTSQVTSMYGLFEETDFQGDVSEWDVSNVTNMSYMFYGCSNFNCDLSKWDVHNGFDITRMFFACKSFNQNISDWDISNVKSMESMFEGCENFNQDLSSWNVRKVRHRAQAFKNCPIKEEYKPKFK